MSSLKEFSDRLNICFMVVHHTRKMESGDSFDMISGTNGLLGAADGALVLQKKKRTDNTATMAVVGRDQEDLELSLCFDRECCRWELVRQEPESTKEPVDPLLEKLGIEQKTPHATRHTYASRARRDGMPPEILQKILGHASYTTTANIYVHTNIEELLAAVEK